MEGISWHIRGAFMSALVAYLVHAVAEGVVCSAVLSKRKSCFSEMATILRTWSSVTAFKGPEMPFGNCWALYFTY